MRQRGSHWFILYSTPKIIDTVMTPCSHELNQVNLTRGISSFPRFESTVREGGASRPLDRVWAVVSLDHLGLRCTSNAQDSATSVTHAAASASRSSVGWTDGGHPTAERRHTRSRWSSPVDTTHWPSVQTPDGVSFAKRLSGAEVRGRIIGGLGLTCDWLALGAWGGFKHVRWRHRPEF